ncbi:MAG TPA: methyltransferase domain-containing protein [Candidatus Binataceae bacterium]|nr:methyltransferase domain-containing protein [Candidatus Binataceae bacterium]
MRLAMLQRVRCPFCDGSVSFAFRRAEAIWGRCASCHAYLRTDRRTIDADLYDDNDFIRRVEGSIGDTANFAGFDEIAPMLRQGSILEIGVGTGHLIAAAKARGRTVSGTEQSPHHRNYVKQHWGIEVTESLPHARFDNVISFNVFEHIADPYQHLLEVRQILNPGGRFILSTANGDCLLAMLCGGWWAMFKPEDHFSIPSPLSLRMVGERANFRVGRIWCSEYPLETPIGVALALRDRIKQGNKGDRSLTKDGADAAPSASGRVQRIRELRAFNFVGATLAQLMMASSIKAIFELP